jgi:hypothetical protein
MDDPTESWSEIETRPHVAVADCDHEIVRLLKEIRQALTAGRTTDQLAFAACGFMYQQVRVLKGEIKRHLGMLEAVAEGQNARAAGKRLADNPYVPDEPDGKWTYWNTGWAAG